MMITDANRRGLERQIKVLLTGIALALWICAIGGAIGGLVGVWRMPVVGDERHVRSDCCQDSSWFLYAPVRIAGNITSVITVV